VLPDNNDLRNRGTVSLGVQAGRLVGLLARNVFLRTDLEQVAEKVETDHPPGDPARENSDKPAMLPVERPSAIQGRHFATCEPNGDDATGQIEREAREIKPGAHCQ
jgi:hypothetical protein